MKITESPVERAMRAGERGDATWPGFDEVYIAIRRAADAMGASKARLSPEHIETMAALGSGHQGRMIARVAWLRLHGWIR